MIDSINATYLRSLATKPNNGDSTAFIEIIKEFPCSCSSLQFKDINLKSDSWKWIIALHVTESEDEGSSETDMLAKCKQRHESIQTAFLVIKLPLGWKVMT